MADDPITGRLDAIRERRAPLEQPGIGLELMLHGLVSAEDVPRLLAAVDAVLDDLHKITLTGNGIRVCGRCSRESGEFVSEAQCSAREVIGRKLAGEDTQ